MLRQWLPDPVRRLARSWSGALPYRRASYSQEGEDLVLARLLEDVDNGFYVDVGAHHPFRFSNTFLFYRRGWRGVNIDAMPGSMRLFRKHRARDINLEIGVAETNGELPFFIFEEPAYNTFDDVQAAQVRASGQSHLIETRTVPCRPLSEIFEAHLPRKDQRIDFLSIDAEGFDLAVLRSNDWSACRPRIVVVEMIGASLEQATRSPQADYLRRRGYAPVSKTAHSVFFRLEEG
jgi:FkbM family methyltransferase